HRLIELRCASFDGTKLTLPDAKKRPGQPPTRTIGDSDLPEDVRTGIGLLPSLNDHDLSKREFAKWRRCPAGQLQRGCERVGIRFHACIASGILPSAVGLRPTYRLARWPCYAATTRSARPIPITRARTSVTSAAPWCALASLSTLTRTAP